MFQDDYTGVLLEDINGKFDTLVDGMVGIYEEIKTLAKQADLDELKQDVKTIKLVVTETNSSLRNLDKRVTKLEKARV